MAKFIVEISDEYIRNHADVSFLQKEMDNGGKKMNMIRAMDNLIGFSFVDKKIKEGVNEFTIRREDFDEDKLQFFDTNVADICIMAQFSAKEG